MICYKKNSGLLRKNTHRSYHDMTKRKKYSSEYLEEDIKIFIWRGISSTHWAFWCDFVTFTGLSSPLLSIKCENRNVPKYNIFDIHIKWGVILSCPDNFLDATLLMKYSVTYNNVLHSSVNIFLLMSLTLIKKWY